jgi:PDZ domain-containing protein
LLGLALLTVLSATPLPWFVIAPGSAVDLNRAVAVGGARPATDRFLLTDVNVTRASPVRLLFALVPGVVLERETHGVAEGVMQDAMAQSESAAAVVAERAAGYPVAIPPPGTIPDLPVPVRYAMGDVEGGSGGLMMALRIYDALHGIGGAPHRTIAGTGTLDFDGRVGPIQGTPQKLIAAKRAGATVFFVPRANYADVAGERGVRIVPVGSFADALRAL